MSRRLIAAHLLMLLLLAATACATPPDVQAWCYKFDFTTSNPFSQSAGTWESGKGYITDARADGHFLALTYQAPAIVQASYIEAGVGREDTSTDAMLTSPAIHAEGTIFGTPLLLEQQHIPIGIISIPSSMTVPDVSTFNTDLNVQIQSEQGLILSYFEVIGIGGGNPFGTSNCGNVVPTPVVIVSTPTTFPTLTSTPSRTPIPTLTSTTTPSPTITLSPTATIVPTWCYQWNFITAQNGFAAGTFLGITSGYNGSGFTSANGGGVNFYTTLSANTTFTPTTITSVLFTYNPTNGSFARTPSNGTNNVLIYLGLSGAQADLVRSTSVTGTNRTISWSGSVTADTIAFAAQLADANNASGYGSGTLTAAKIQGLGTSPFGDNCSPTPTPTPTATLTYTPGPTLTPSITYTPSITPSATVTLTRTPISTWTPVPGTASPQPTPSRTPVIINNPPSFTPQPTINRTATQQNRETQTATRATATRNAQLTQTAVIITGTANAQATGTATVGGTGTPSNIGTPNGVGDVSPMPVGTPGEAGNGNNTDVDLGKLGGALVVTVGNFFNSAFGWVGNLGQFGNFVNAWNNTAAVPPPSLPRCRTAPLSSELCAIWYILTYTVLAGTTGSLLVPAGTVVVNLYSFFFFLRFARAIIARVVKIFQ